MEEHNSSEPARRIQIADAIEPVGYDSVTPPGIVKLDKSANVSEKIQDISDEEKARAIADDDINGSRKQTYSGLVVLWLSFQSTGVIYGDIGTSPLYVYSSTFTSQPSWDDLVGALSIIIWSLTLIVTIKYTFIVLRADDDGQGGTFALYSLLSRYTNIVTRDPAESGMLKMERYRTNDLKPGGRGLRSLLENSSTAKFGLKMMGVLGVAMVMADGILTPAQSVLGAIQGIKVANPALDTPAIVGISCAILVFLFFLQPFGTSKIGTSFAPVVTVWLLFNLACGIYNLVLHDHTVLKAFSPYFAFTYLIRNGYDGWKSLGGLLLAFTGVEALFADLGAFSKRAIQLSWLCLAYPCLLIAYIGQAAFISVDPTGEAYTNPFFNTVPPGSFWFAMILAVLAAIVASQAMITSSFQLLSQVMRMSYFPHIKVVHTSKRFHEQVYIPLANWLMMIGTVVVTAVYNNTTSLGNAYGACVIVVTSITTCMVALVAVLIWRLPIYVVLPVFLVFISLDGAYISSVLTKVPEGAWFTLLLALILSSIFILWRFGKEAQWHAESLDHLPPSALLTLPGPSEPPSTLPTLNAAFGATPVSTVPGLGIFFDKKGDPAYLPPSFTHFVRKFAARPSVLVFFHMRPLPVPSVPNAERFVVHRVAGLPAAYAVTLRHGYADDVLRPGLARDLVAQIELVAARRIPGHGVEASAVVGGAETGTGTGTGADAGRAPPGRRGRGSRRGSTEELDTLRAACAAQTVYVLGKEAMRIRKVEGKKGWLAAWVRGRLLGTFLWIRENSRAKLADLDIDVDKLIEVGFVKEI